MRKRTAIKRAALFAVTALVAQSSFAQDKPWGVDLATAFYTDYMFRGFQSHDGTSIQPSVVGSYSLGDYGKVSGNTWSHLSAESDDQEQELTEVDYTLRHDLQIGSWGMAWGHIWYTYPDDRGGVFKDTSEFFASLVAPLPLNPVFTVFEDYDTFDAQYYELGFSHTLESAALGDGFNITPFFNLGFASNAEKVYADNGLVQFTTGASFKLNLGDIVVVPSFNYTRGVDDLTENEFWSGTSLSYSF